MDIRIRNQALEAGPLKKFPIGPLHAVEKRTQLSLRELRYK